MQRESCIKTIGEIARMIEEMPFEDYVVLMVKLAGKEEKTIDKPLVIGEND